MAHITVVARIISRFRDRGQWRFDERRETELRRIGSISLAGPLVTVRSARIVRTGESSRVESSRVESSRVSSNADPRVWTVSARLLPRLPHGSRSRVRAFVPRSLGARASRNAQFSIFCVPGTLKSAGPSLSRDSFRLFESSRSFCVSRFADSRIRRWRRSRARVTLASLDLPVSLSLSRTVDTFFHLETFFAIFFALSDRSGALLRVDAATSRSLIPDRARWEVHWSARRRGLCAITHLSRIRPRRARNRKSARGIVSSAVRGTPSSFGEIVKAAARDS